MNVSRWHQLFFYQKYKKRYKYCYLHLSFNCDYLLSRPPPEGLPVVLGQPPFPLLIFTCIKGYIHKLLHVEFCICFASNKVFTYNFQTHFFKRRILQFLYIILKRKQRKHLLTWDTQQSKGNVHCYFLIERGNLRNKLWRMILMFYFTFLYHSILVLKIYILLKIPYNMPLTRWSYISLNHIVLKRLFTLSSDSLLYNSSLLLMKLRSSLSMVSLNLSFMFSLLFLVLK